MDSHYSSTIWVNLDNSNIQENDFSTYPNEGIEVIVSDDIGNEEKLYFLMSGEYVWMKINEDEANIFNNFIPTKWKAI